MSTTPIPSFAFPRSPYTVTRKSAAGSYVNGVWVPAAGSATFTITASVQRLSPEETLLLPEAYRTRRSYRVYTETELRDANESTGVEADKISIEGENYTILQVEQWFQLMPHFKAIAVRDERNAQ